MIRQITVGLDVFSHIWAQRLPHEVNEDEILIRLLKLKPRVLESQPKTKPSQPSGSAPKPASKPTSKKWLHVLIWTLQQHGGKATLAEIYKTSRQRRLSLGIAITAEHDASARECLESHCRDSNKYRDKADVFYMPEGKGAGIWALR